MVMVFFREREREGGRKREKQDIIELPNTTYKFWRFGS